MQKYFEPTYCKVESRARKLPFLLAAQFLISASSVSLILWQGMKKHRTRLLNRFLCNAIIETNLRQKVKWNITYTVKNTLTLSSAMTPSRVFVLPFCVSRSKHKPKLSNFITPLFINRLTKFYDFIDKG